MEVLSMGLLYEKRGQKAQQQAFRPQQMPKRTASRLHRKGSELSYFDSTEGIDDTASCLLLSNTFA